MRLGSLLDRVGRDGDEAAFRELYREYTPRLARFARRILGAAEPMEVEDVVQESWVRAVQRAASFNGHSSLLTWLHGIALNVARERLRSRRVGEELGAEALGASPGPDVERRIDLERALTLLPEKRRLVLVLHDLEGYPHRAIAERLGISVGTSKSQLHDARRQMGSLLKGRDG